MRNDYKMNSEINVIEIFWRFFEQWKAVLLFSVVVAILFTCVKYASDINLYNSKTHKPTETSEDTNVYSDAGILDGLNEQDKEAVEAQLKEKEVLDAIEDYYNNSLLFQIDPQNCGQIQIQYEVEASIDEEEALVEAYENSLMSEESATIIAKAIGSEIDKKYIYELFKPSAQQNGASSSAVVDANKTLVVRMLVPKVADAEELKNALNDALLCHKEMITRAFGKHDIKIISSEAITFSDYDLANKQSEVMAKLADAKSNCTKNYALLTDTQRAAYNEINRLRTGEDDETPVTDYPKPKLSAKIFVVGFILAAGIYGIIMGIMLLIRRRVISENDTTYFPGARSLYRFTDNKAKKGLFHSDFVRNIRRRKALSIEDQVKACADTIALIFERENLKKVTILSPGEVEKNCDALIVEVCSRLTRSGFEVSKIEYKNTEMDIDIRELVESSPIIPIIIEDLTSLDGFNNLMNKCVNYRVDVVGTMYYGTR